MITAACEVFTNCLWAYVSMFIHGFVFLLTIRVMIQLFNPVLYSITCIYNKFKICFPLVVDCTLSQKYICCCKYFLGFNLVIFFFDTLL